METNRRYGKERFGEKKRIRIGNKEYINPIKVKEEKKMYLFVARYINMESEDEIIREITFEGQYIESEKEGYLCAMEKAYDMIEKNEYLAALEFIAC